MNNQYIIHIRTLIKALAIGLAVAENLAAATVSEVADTFATPDSNLADSSGNLNWLPAYSGSGWSATAGQMQNVSGAQVAVGTRLSVDLPVGVGNRLILDFELKSMTTPGQLRLGVTGTPTTVGAPGSSEFPSIYLQHDSNATLRIASRHGSSTIYSATAGSVPLAVGFYRLEIDRSTARLFYSSSTKPDGTGTANCVLNHNQDFTAVAWARGGFGYVRWNGTGTFDNFRLASSFIPLAVSGVPAGKIVYRSSAPTKSAQLGALELKKHLDLITGASYLVVREGSEGTGRHIYLGDTNAAAAHGLGTAMHSNQEFGIYRRGGHIFILGRDYEQSDVVNILDRRTFPCRFENHGTLAGVYEFLERFCGVRWYLPTDLGISYTTDPDLGVNVYGDLRRRPTMEYRDSNYSYRLTADLVTDTGLGKQNHNTLSWEEQMLWLYRQRLGGVKYVATHTLTESRLQKMKASFPTWFETSGSRNFVSMTNSNLDGYYSGLVSQFYVQSPDGACIDMGWPVVTPLGSGSPRDSVLIRGDYISVVPDDAFNAISPGSLALLDPNDASYSAGFYMNGHFSGLVWPRVNSIARRFKNDHPTRRVGALAYSHYAKPPAEQLESNVVPMLCMALRNTYAIENQTHEEGVMNSWLAHLNGRPLYVWLYYNFPVWNADRGGFKSFPGFCARTIGARIKSMAQRGVKGVFVEHGEFVAPNGTPFRDIAMSHLEEYVTWKLADDATLDPEVLINEFYVRFYGDAANTMKLLYEQIAGVYENPANYPALATRKLPHQDEQVAWENLGTKAVMSSLENLMRTAEEEVAGGDPIFVDRVAFFRSNVMNYMIAGASDYRGVPSTSFAFNFQNYDNLSLDYDFRQHYDLLDYARIAEGLLQISAFGVASRNPLYSIGETVDGRRVRSAVIEMKVAGMGALDNLQVGFSNNMNKNSAVTGVDKPIIRVGVTGLRTPAPYNWFLRSQNTISGTDLATGKVVTRTYPLGQNFNGGPFTIRVEVDAANVRVFLAGGSAFPSPTAAADWSFLHNQDLSAWFNGLVTTVYCGGTLGDFVNGMKISELRFYNVFE